MSKEEIQAAQKAILQQLGMSHTNALEKFKTNFGQAKMKPKKVEIEYENEASDSDEDFDSQRKNEASIRTDLSQGSSNLIETGKVSEAVHEAASKMEA